MLTVSSKSAIQDSRLEAHPQHQELAHVWLCAHDVGQEAAVGAGVISRMPARIRNHPGFSKDMGHEQACLFCTCCNLVSARPS